jgi:tetratricopeptide (TPR) repeat protein
MKHFLGKLSLLSIIIIVSVYFFGCTSAELTTGKLAYQQRDFVKAEQELSKGLMIDKSDDEGWFMLGYSQVELGKFDEAKTSFKTSLGISSKFGDKIYVYYVDKYNAGISAFNGGINSLKKSDSLGAVRNFKASLNYFKSTAAIIPDSISSYQMIGDCYNALGKKDSALIIYKDILKNSKSKDDANSIAKILFNNGMKAREVEDWDKAIDSFKEIISIPYLSKDSVYYTNSLFNIGYSYTRKAALIIADTNIKNSSELIKPHLNNAITYLENLVSYCKNKELLVNSYELLIAGYEGVKDDKKLEEAKKKRAELNK